MSDKSNKKGLKVLWGLTAAAAIAEGALLTALVVRHNQKKEEKTPSNLTNPAVTVDYKGEIQKQKSIFEKYKAFVNKQEVKDIYIKTNKELDETLKLINDSLKNKQISDAEAKEVLEKLQQANVDYYVNKAVEYNLLLKDLKDTFNKIDLIKKDYKKEELVKYGLEKYEDIQLNLGQNFEPNSLYQNFKDYMNKVNIEDDKNNEEVVKYHKEISTLYNKISSSLNLYDQKWEKNKEELAKSIVSIEKYVEKNPYDVKIQELKDKLEEERNKVDSQQKLDETNLTKLEEYQNSLKIKKDEILDINKIDNLKTLLDKNLKEYKDWIKAKIDSDTNFASYYSYYLKEVKMDYHTNWKNNLVSTPFDEIIKNMEDALNSNNIENVKAALHFSSSLKETFLLWYFDYMQNNLLYYKDLKEKYEKSILDKEEMLQPTNPDLQYYQKTLNDFEEKYKQELEQIKDNVNLTKEKVWEKTYEELFNFCYVNRTLAYYATGIKDQRETHIKKAKEAYASSTRTIEKMENKLVEYNVTPATYPNYDSEIVPLINKAKESKDKLKDPYSIQDNAELKKLTDECYDAINALYDKVHSFIEPYINETKALLDEVSNLYDKTYRKYNKVYGTFPDYAKRWNDIINVNRTDVYSEIMDYLEKAKQFKKDIVAAVDKVNTEIYNKVKPVYEKYLENMKQEVWYDNSEYQSIKNAYQREQSDLADLKIIYDNKNEAYNANLNNVDKYIQNVNRSNNNAVVIINKLKNERKGYLDQITPNIPTIVEYSKKPDAATKLPNVLALMQAANNNLEEYFNKLTNTQLKNEIEHDLYAKAMNEIKHYND